ncbi:MAG: FAD-dependent oxidoreductase [Clostridiales bacterium]|nr:FAD-dependent oxidoreductase [Clostridiales bacterium]MCF8022313.1 FAD-dependent oxidoreductase [Clostridiales bacterium]
MRLNTFIIFITLLIISFITTSCRAIEPDTDILIYGGGFAACAAAATAADTAPELQIKLVVPYPENKLGGIGTVGGQNFMDLRFWQDNFVTKGSLYRWYIEAGRFYSTQKMSSILENEIKSHPNISVTFGKDILNVNCKNQEIFNLTMQPVKRKADNSLAWSGKPEDISARVYVDASEGGRLARLAGIPSSIGRQDWPDEFLPRDEQYKPIARQQAATLMFKVQSVQTPSEQSIISGWQFVQDHTDSWGLAGGKHVFHTNQQVKNFNRKFGPRGFVLKPVNAAQDGAYNNEWWVNALLVFNVDGRARNMDRGTENYPRNMLPGSITIDQALQDAQKFINRPEFIKAFRQFTVQDKKTGKKYGFHNAELVREENGKPVVGDILYTRETIHSIRKPYNTGSGPEKTSFALQPSACQQAGTGPENGADTNNYQHRIGLAHYFMDINAYCFKDMLVTGSFKWPVTKYARPDWAKNGQPANPVYLPYEMLISPDAKNLLLPGYAAGASSMAWSQVRVLPNLSVLGDAAGAAAAVSVNQQVLPCKFKDKQIKIVQQNLKKINARLDK